jgi:hypothetical protein
VKTPLKISILWLIANFIGISAYLLFECWLLAPHPEVGPQNGIDQKVAWLFTAFPVLILFIILNIIWFISTIRSGRPSGWWTPLPVWLLAVSAWVVAIFGYSNIGITMLSLFIDMIDGRAWK